MMMMMVTVITVVTQSVWQMADGGISNYKRSVWCGYSAGPFSIAGWGPVAGDGDIFTRSQGCPVSRLQTPESTHLTTTTKIATTPSTTRRLWAHQLRRKCCKIMFVQFYLFWIDAKPSLTISDDVIMLDGEYFVLVSVNFKYFNWRYDICSGLDSKRVFL